VLLGLLYAIMCYYVLLCAIRCHYCY